MIGQVLVRNGFTDWIEPEIGASKATGVGEENSKIETNSLRHKGGDLCGKVGKESNPSVNYP